MRKRFQTSEDVLVQAGRVGSRVLVVDDHVAFRAFARLFLDEIGYTVVGEAADGRSGIEAAANLRPDLVLLDIQLPDIDGFEVARRITATADAPAVVLISTRDARDYGNEIRASGARGFLSKSQLSGTAVRALVE